MNIKQEAELFYKAVTRVSNRVDKADDLTAIIARLEIDLEKLERENLGLRQQVEKYGLQYLDDINNPLEPLKLKSALDSEIFKYNYRKEHRPKDASVLDITIMYALKHCLDDEIRKQVEV